MGEKTNRRFSSMNEKWIENERIVKIVWISIKSIFQISNIKYQIEKIEYNIRKYIL